MRKFIKKLLVIAALSISAVAITSTSPSVVARGLDAKYVAPTTYYSDADTSSGEKLIKSLTSIISNGHKAQGYDALWTAYQTTDIKPGTTDIVWDMYSNTNYNVKKDHGGNYSKEGDMFNREHTVPQSWFSKNNPMVCDVHHIYPTDGKVNGMRSSYLHGEVDQTKTIKYKSTNGCMLGTSSSPYYSGTVFEVPDEYKGDFARTYFYMATRYSSQVGSWGGEANKVFKGSFPYLTTYSIDMYTKWDAMDPVSEKEIVRNDAAYKFQGNRNPFIDHPEYASIIWPSQYNQNVSVDENKVNNVIGLINSLPKTITLDDKEEINRVNTAYSVLNFKEKPLVTNYSTLQNALAALKKLEGPTEIEDAITVARALEIAKALSDKEVTTNTYKVTGVISGNIEAYNSQYGNATFDMNDGAGESIIVWRAKDNGANFTANSFAEKIAVGKTVTVEGKIQKYVNKDNSVQYEIVNGSVEDTVSPITPVDPVEPDPVDPDPVNPDPVTPVTPTGEAITIKFESVKTNSYELDKTFTVDGKAFKSNVLFATDGTVGTKGAFIRVGYNSSNVTAIPAKFGISGDGGSLEMDFDVEKAIGIKFNIGGEMTNGKDISKWNIFASYDGGQTWASAANGTTFTDSISLSLSSAKTARFALVIQGKNPRLDLRSITINVASDNPTPVNPDPVDPKPTVNAISVSEALNIVKSLSANEKTKDKYIVTGIISGNIEAYNAQYGNATFDMNDGTGEAITVFRAKDGSSDFTATSFASKIAVGKTITVEGYLQKFDNGKKTTLEICECKVVDLVPVELPVDIDLSEVRTNSYLKVTYQTLKGEIQNANVKAVAISHIEKEYNTKSAKYGVIYTKKTNVSKLIKLLYKEGSAETLATLVNGKYVSCSVKENENDVTVEAVLDLDMNSDYVAVVVCEQNGEIIFANQATLNVKNMVNYYLTNNLIKDEEQIKVLESFK